ncbi:protein-tyrosine phosphatase family protein [Paenibacillus lignilyticus]|uniref:Dual specificity protein phosphatase family protein n=1 Tax=Paenibacillus lignilyticus TaxID=1172615 RepID=A0ABS5C9A4_9BACL|nr:dual specificity protein phosphatase family protein [Paenibacillus lignilyticus]MBP3962582.1 dual specificity protein phosphatase family protein [Paenibacillus lignilyticus]
MSQEKNYHTLHDNMIFMGGAADVESMVKNEGVEVIVDLRAEATEYAYPEADVTWIQVPLEDNTEDLEEELFEEAINHVLEAYKSGKKVGFHCGGGKSRTGTVAAGILIALGESNTVNEAEQKAKSIRSIINIKPPQLAALKKIFPNN